MPLGMAALAFLLYAVLAATDVRAIDETHLRRWQLYSGDGDDARNLLSTLVSAIITMSSVVFSITLVALSLGANQFGSRLVRTYMSDNRTKLALGLFTLTIVYCLLALRGVHKGMSPADVPHLAVSAGLVLALTCVITLLLFLHFVARSVVADDVIRNVARELNAHIEQLPELPQSSSAQDAADTFPANFDAEAIVLRAQKQGYVQAIEFERLLEIASECDLRIRLDFRAGTFVVRDGWLARVYPPSSVTSEIAADIRAQILIGANRTPTQDLEFVIRHMVDIALRALSPGINDANSALVVIDHLSGALAALANKEIYVARCRDRDGVVRVIGKQNDYAGILGAALHQIRQSGAGQPAVIIQMLRAIATIAEHIRREEQRTALLDQAELIAAAGSREASEAADRSAIERALSATRGKLTTVPLQTCHSVDGSAEPRMREKAATTAPATSIR